MLVDGLKDLTSLIIDEVTGWALHLLARGWCVLFSAAAIFPIAWTDLGGAQMTTPVCRPFTEPGDEESELGFRTEIDKKVLYVSARPGG